MKKERNKVEFGSMEGCSSVGDGNGKKRAEKDQEEAVEINQVMENNPPPDNETPPIYFPPGYHFHPNDDELILNYLLPKLQNKKLPYNHIKDVVLADYDPEVLTAKYKCIEKSEWYFFTPRERKYKKGSRPNRAAGSGYWKATGVDIPIKSNGETVGFKKSLVFYRGKPPNGGKSNWIVNEYRIKGGVFEGTSRERDMSSMRLDDWVLCKIYEKTNSKNVSEESPISSSSRDCEKESPSACLRDHENESLIASQSDSENKSPIAYQRDRENEYLVACQRDYGDEKMKKVMEESSHGNKMTTLDISSYWYGDERMNMVMGESSYGSKMITPEITSSKIISNESSTSPSSRDYEKESPITRPGDHENESLIACQRDHENKSPIAYQRDQFHNDYVIACNRAYGDEKMKMVMDEPSHGNKTISTPEFSSGTFDWDLFENFKMNYIRVSSCMSGFVPFFLTMPASFWAGSSLATFLSGIVTHGALGYTIVVATLAYFLLFIGFFSSSTRIGSHWNCLSVLVNRPRNIIASCIGRTIQKHGKRETQEMSCTVARSSLAFT
ncbi:hypothetical protein AAC387_Pa03g2687 [Persea americana]